MSSLPMFHRALSLISSTRRLGGFLFAAAVLGAAPGCDTDDADGDGASEGIARIATGIVAGTDIYAATVHDDDQAITYFCGGDATFSTHTRWFSAATTGDRLEHMRDGWTVSGAFDAEGSHGTLTGPDGDETTYTTQAVASGSIAGLYSTKVGSCTAGVVIVDEDSAQGTYFCPEDAAAAVQVIILSPVTLAPNGGIDVSVELPDGPQMLTVVPQ